MDEDHDKQGERRARSLEQNVTTILVMLIAGGIVWIGSSIVDVKGQLASLGDKFALRVDLEVVRVKVDDVAKEQARRSFIIESLRKERQ